MADANKMQKALETISGFFAPTAADANTMMQIARAALAERPERGEAVALTNDQIARHTLNAGECPPNSQVILVSSIRRLAARNAAPRAPSVSVPMAPPAAFSEWLRSNMPPDTIISDPDWWAMAIWSAARRAINAAPVAPSVPDEMWAGPPHNVDYVNGWNACRDAMLAAAPEPPRCTPYPLHHRTPEEK